jgi:FkbM family methyltransferase
MITENACNSLTNLEVEDRTLVASYETDVITLDSWCPQGKVEHIDFLKTDAEGNDLCVLEGARDGMDAQASTHSVLSVQMGGY